MIISMNLGADSYDILLERGALSKADRHFKLDRKVLIVTDSGVPAEYAETVASCCKAPYIEVFPQGEAQKNMDTYQNILARLVKEGFSRTDCVVAVGGGVCGDLAGFVAASYMRGVDFYNIPTTLLSQVDSSIGGKVAVNLGGYKNTVGAFYQPKCVIVDPELLLTLDIEQIRSGLAESLKMATTSDAELFEIFESGSFLDDIGLVIERSLLIKKGIVERDEKESGERKILNFGHTVGHAVESLTGMLHGHAVAVGMLYVCSPSVRERLLPIYDVIGLPCSAELGADELYGFILRDKKADGRNITLTYVNEIGKAELIKMPIEKIKDLL